MGLISPAFPAPGARGLGGRTRALPVAEPSGRRGGREAWGSAPALPPDSRPPSFSAPFSSLLYFIFTTAATARFGTARETSVA